MSGVTSQDTPRTEYSRVILFELVSFIIASVNQVYLSNFFCFLLEFLRLVMLYVFPDRQTLL